MAGYPLQTGQQSTAVLNSQEVFRLRQFAQSPGDMIRLDGSAKAVVIGPESDIANYNLWYYDQQTPDKINKQLIGPGAPRIGRLDAYGDLYYPPMNGGESAPILISPEDLWLADYTPAGFNDLTMDLWVEPPVIDIISMFQMPGALGPSSRNDKVYKYPVIYNTHVGFTVAWYMFPVYGRKLTTWQLVNAHGAINIAYDIQGVRFGVGQVAGGGSSYGLCAAKSLATGTVNAGTSGYEKLPASSLGMWDYLQIQLTMSANLTYGYAAMTVETSDVE